MQTEFHRILVVDDNAAIHEDFRKIFARPDQTTANALAEFEAVMFNEPAAPRTQQHEFRIDTASHGQEGLARVVDAQLADRPYEVAFVDMRMPPGWDGLETIERLWQADPDLQVIICSAYSDYSWENLRARLGERDSLLIIKKPFDPIEVVQSAHALSTKWRLARKARAHLEDLETAVRVRTAELESANQRLSAEMREREQVEEELRLAQRLEAIGQLAAGVAHEINTPIQFVGDSLHFVRDGVSELITLVSEMRSATDGMADLQRQFDVLAEAVDLPYLDSQIPLAIDRMTDGVARVATIVRSMKELANPGPRELQPVDLNHILHNSLLVTGNSYKCVADVELALGELPAVAAYAGDLGQVFLNLIVNAAHAMEGRSARGVLRIASRVDGDHVVISIGDTGAGIPDAIRERIFDAFFTTRDVGRGSGQGLAISRKIVVDRHGGSLTFESTLGLGTTFFVRLPIAGPSKTS